MWICFQVPLSQLILSAYGVELFQITLPEGVGNQRFNVNAKVPPGTTQAQFRHMQQRLLAERFKLALHHEKRETQVCELTVEKSGPKMKPAAGTEFQTQQQGVLPAFTLDKLGFPVFPTNVAGRGGLNGRNRWTAFSVSMEEVTRVLATALQRAVIDSTGLKGKYDLDLHWVNPPKPGKIVPGRPESDAQTPEIDDGPDIQRAIKDQLGLKVESKKGRADMLVIDHVEKLPVEN